MAKLDQTYVYYDNRRIQTHYAVISFTELETAYTKLTSGSSMRLYLYLLHKISGRTTHDRNNQPRHGYYLGIEQIEAAIGISRASIYRGFNDLVKFGLIQKHVFKSENDSKNVICSLSIPLTTETDSLSIDTDHENSGSQYRDRQISKIEPLQQTTTKKPDLNIESINLTPLTPIIKPLIPKGNNLKNDFKNQKRKAEIYQIVSELQNHGYSFIDSTKEFSNIYTWIRKDTNCSRRKRDIYQAIEIHNQKIKIKDNLQELPEPAEPEKNSHSANEAIQKQAAALQMLLDCDYNDTMHGSLLKKGSYIFQLPIELQNKFIPELQKKINKGKKS